MKITGICGGSCSLKTSLSKAIQLKYRDEISVIHMDNYFKDTPSPK